MLVFFSDRRVLIGIGVGLILGSFIMLFVSLPSKEMTNAEIENKARGMGMEYPTEFKFK